MQQEDYSYEMITQSLQTPAETVTSSQVQLNLDIAAQPLNSPLHSWSGSVLNTIGDPRQVLTVIVLRDQINLYFNAHPFSEVTNDRLQSGHGPAS